MTKLSKFLFFVTSVFILNTAQAHTLELAVASTDRSPANVLRDEYRNPLETLSFFGLESDMTVIELSPGGGWYTEILANFIHYPGTLIAAHFNPEAGNYYAKSRKRFEDKIDSDPMYGRVEIVNIDSGLSALGTVDAILTFRNLHNWIGPQFESIFQSSYKSLKKGGILGVVEHRAPEGMSLADMKRSGYVTQDYAIKEIEKLGFKFIDSSEINSNPKDIKNYPKGVWTLPPSLRLKEQDKNFYNEIGESDRMTLLFKKP